MHKRRKYMITGGVLILLLCMMGAADAKSWRNLKPIPAFRITWQKGIIGMVDNDKTRLYHLTGQGAIGIMPFLGKGPDEGELDARHQYIGQWLTRHPKAMAMPVEAYPFFSKTVARIYIWIVDGPENLNLELVRKGLLSGDYLMTILQDDDLYITPKQLWAFRKKVLTAQIEAAQAQKGIWADPDYRRSSPPDKLYYPGMEALARFEHAAENTPDPPPVYGPKTPVTDLIRIADGDDNAASHAALTELIRRAKSGTLPTGVFKSIIIQSLERQADLSRQWRNLYGNLIELAYQQGRLVEAQIEGYARHAVVPQLKTTVFKDVLHSKPQLTIGGEARVGLIQTSSVLRDNSEGKLLLVAAYRVRQLKIDGVPVRNFKTNKGMFDNWSYQLYGGKKEKQYRLNAGQTLAPGMHTITGQLEIRILKGIAAWNAAGQARETPDSIKPLATLKLEIDSLFNITQ